MIPHPTSPDQTVRVARYGVQMADAGLPGEFVSRVIRLAMEDQGVFEIMELWVEAESEAERGPVVADLQDVLDEVEEPGPRVKPRIGFDKLDDVADAVVAHKRRLRDLVDRHGGVTAVARKMGVPQPSLSRMLGSASMPRRTTLYRLARALGVDESEVVTEWVR